MKEQGNRNNNLAAKTCVAYRGYMDGSVEFFGDQIVVLTGYDKEEFNSKRLKWHDLIMEEFKASTKESFIKALKTTKVFNRSYKIKTRNLSTPWVQEWGQIVCDDSGNISFVLGILLDITQEKELEEERLKCEALTGEYLLFIFDEDLYAINIHNVMQVIDEYKITPIPGMPEYLKGVIDFGDTATPVIDLRIKLGMPSSSDSRAGSIIIVESRKNGDFVRVGLSVDGISRVSHIDGREIMDPPKLLTNMKVDYILGIAKDEDKLKIVLDIENFVRFLDLDGLDPYNRGSICSHGNVP